MIRYFLFVPFLLSCSLEEEDIISKEIVSSKGEKIYINSKNYGVTGDHQFSIVTHDKNRLKNHDTVGSTRGLNPFEYRFFNDTLTLYFRNEVTYQVKEQFATIFVEYKIMSSDYYSSEGPEFTVYPDSTTVIKLGR